MQKISFTYKGEIMIHVLIIEDEPAIARGLSLLITKNYPDFQISGICKNGRDGLQKILELKPELVFTDITMPVMNGLDMIEEVQRNHLHTRFVILTGYADFEYARKAIHLGVSDYLLKPIDLKTLDDILLSCLEQQKSETRLLQKEYLQCAVRSDKLSAGDPDFMNGFHCSFVFVFQGPLCSSVYGETIPDSRFRPLSPEILFQLEQEYPVYIHLLYGRHQNEQVYALVYASSDQPDLLSLAEKIQHLLSANTEDQESDIWLNTILARASDGSSVTDLIKDTYLFALFHNCFGSSSIKICSSVSDQKILISQEVKQLCAGISSSSDQDCFYHMIHSLITLENRKNISQFQLTADLRYYISAVIQNCHRDIVYPDVAEIVSTCYSYEELERELQYETDKICGFHIKTPGEELPSLARQVRNYLDRNFTQQITTKSFQDIFGYNEKYISTLFKSEFGISPSKYISELRLKMAKTLMQNNPDILTKDVAEMVGFSDAFYFSRVFKSHEGMSPSQFLKNFRKD